MFKRVAVYIIIMTWLFAQMDWRPIHQSYLEHGHFPDASVNEWWPRNTAIRTLMGKVLCPPCAALAEHYYFVFFEVEASNAERNDLLLKHAPYSGNLISPSPDGAYFWWGEGGEDNSNPWKKVSVLAWWLYWLPYIVLWWWLYAHDAFHGRWPWWWTKMNIQFPTSLRPIGAALIAFLSYVLMDILIWQRIFEHRELMALVPEVADQYHLGWFVGLMGFVAVGMILLPRREGLIYAAYLLINAFSGLEDILFYWLDGRAIPATLPWLNWNPMVFGNRDVIAVSLLLSALFWQALFWGLYRRERLVEAVKRIWIMCLYGGGPDGE